MNAAAATCKQPLEAVDPWLVLLGRPPISDFLRTIRMGVLSEVEIDEQSLVREWSAANAHIEALQSTEAGWANTPALLPLDGREAELAEAQLEDPAARRQFRFTPHRWAMVELDRLVVWQSMVNLRAVTRIEDLLPPVPRSDDIVRIAIGKSIGNPPIRTTRLTDNLYAFSSESPNMRFLDIVPLNPSTVAGYQSTGQAEMLVGVAVGFGINFITAIHVHDRLVLHNGTHRAYALRKLGVTHAPCLVQFVSREDELELIGAERFRQNATAYLHSPRPPVFKDYFDPHLHRTVSIPRTKHVLHVQFVTQQSRVPVD